MKNLITILFCGWLGAYAGNADAKPCKASQDDARQSLVEAQALIKAGKSERAITECIQPVIDRFENARKGSQKRFYSAQNQTQVFMYVALPTDKSQGVEVMGGEWADAYLLKAYALTELGKTSEAQTALEAAVGLSPLNSQYQSELAYTYQVQKDCDKSIEAYRQAASVAELGSDEETTSQDLARAWRGEGYCLVEQGKLDEAEALYRKCLEADPNDRKAQGELRYIQGLRKQ